MTDPVLRPARSGEGPLLSALALRSKGHWGYSAAFLESVRLELTVHEDRLEGVTVAEVDGQVAGFSRLTQDGERAELHALFVDPPWIGTGVGGALLTAALRQARARGVREVGLDADPGAEPFYARFGAVTVGTSPSGSIPGRTLPRMVFSL
ncbi:GNAT family N-acetyltransferase [Georgenia alba]|uniref:GNAT family N-acetyltransferase n=1 Tax=Georgenia alba TaxID=2233858 RepID=A0ABW2Q5A5_9MICO